MIFIKNGKKPSIFAFGPKECGLSGFIHTFRGWILLCNCNNLKCMDTDTIRHGHKNMINSKKAGCKGKKTKYVPNMHQNLPSLGHVLLEVERQKETKS